MISPIHNLPSFETNTAQCQSIIIRIVLPNVTCRITPTPSD